MNKRWVFFLSFIVIAITSSVVIFLSQDKHFLRRIGNILKGMPEKNATYNIQYRLRRAFPVTENKPIVVIIPSYNNVSVCRKNLASVFEQTYPNYRVIYIDDCSSDHTFEKVKETITFYQKEDKVTLIHNETRRGAAANLYDAIHSCQDNEIVALLDGDDWLAHENVLQKINSYYANPDVWVTYGKAIEHPKYTKICGERLSDKDLLDQKARDDGKFVIAMLRTFYAGIYKNIKLEDLMFEGSFLKMAQDMACMFPVVEMSKEHVYAPNEILYIINRNNPINDSKVDLFFQQKMDQHIRSLPKYAALEKPFGQKKAVQGITIVLRSEDSPLYLYASLESITTYVKDVEKVYVLFSASSEEFLRAYNEVAKVFSSAHFIEGKDLNKIHMTSSHYLVGRDDLVFKEPVSLKVAASLLEKTHAYAYCFIKDNTLLPVKLSLSKEDSILQLDALQEELPLLNSGMMLYRKEQLLKVFGVHAQKPASGTAILLSKVQKLAQLPDATSFYAFSKNDLLKKFQGGEKIALTSIRSLNAEKAQIQFAQR